MGYGLVNYVLLIYFWYGLYNKPDLHHKAFKSKFVGK